MPFEGDEVVEVVYDPDKVHIVGWEYSANGWDKNYTPTKPTHKVVWLRPVFKEHVVGA